MKSAMKHRMLKRDEMAYADLPESGVRESSSGNRLGGRQPSDMIQQELDTVPLFQTNTFKPALDEFLKNGPSSDVEKVKNLAAEIAAMSSQIDPTRLSTELDNTIGIGNSRNFGPLRSGDLGFSINSFSSLVDFGDLDAKSPQQRNMSWQKSVSELMPNEDKPENYHKEYKCYESGEKKRLTSKDWTIDYQQNTTTFTPRDEASTELTNNVVTYVQLNDMDQGGEQQQRPVAQPRPERPESIRERQMSVEINTANVGIDSEGRLGSYELVTTQLNMQPNGEFDPVPLPPQGYQLKQPQQQQQMFQQQQNNMHQQHNNFDQNNFMPGNNNGNYGGPPQQPNRDFLRQQFQQQGGGLLEQQFGQPQYQQDYQHQSQPYPQEQLSHPVPQLQRPPTISQQQQSIGSQIQGLGLVVPPRPAVKLANETGVIDPMNIQDGDVLLERGGKGNHHKGSKYYRRLINERRTSYQELPDSARAEKMAISLSVVMSVKATGARFIHKRKGQYIVMGDREARNKISQALREKKERVMLDD